MVHPNSAEGAAPSEATVFPTAPSEAMVHPNSAEGAAPSEATVFPTAPSEAMVHPNSAEGAAPSEATVRQTAPSEARRTNKALSKRLQDVGSCSRARREEEKKRSIFLYVSILLRRATQPSGKRRHHPSVSRRGVRAGRRSTIGNRVCVNAYRGFESHSLRHIDCTMGRGAGAG